MQASNEIVKILSAMGAKPIATTTKNGTVTIKINAPKVKEIRMVKPND